MVISIVRSPMRCCVHGMLPAEVLDAWRSARELLGSSAHAEPLVRWQRWLACLAARASCSGGRLGEWLVELGLCSVEQLVDCLLAQLDAGAIDDSAILHDIEDDLWVVQRHGTLEQLERLSQRIEECEWRTLLAAADSLHASVAEQALALGRADVLARALARIGWHLPLLELLEQHGAELEPSSRERLAARTWELIERSGLARDHHVGLFTRLAVLTGDHERFERARMLAGSLAPEELAATPDHPFAYEDIAWGLARLDRWAEAEAMVMGFEPGDRWPGLLRLLPLAPSAEIRAKLIDEAVALVEPLEQEWAWMVEAVPETAERALAAIRREADVERRLEALGLAARYMRGEQARSACVELLELQARVGHVPGSKAWERTWELVLDALLGSGCEALLGPAARRELIRVLLDQPELDPRVRGGPEVLLEAVELVPDDLAEVVLAHASAALARADHYLDRERWLEVGVRLLDRVPPARAEEFRSAALPAVVRTCFDRGAAARLSAFSPAQRQAIVLARLRQHRCEFLPRLVFGSWLAHLGWTLPTALWRRAAERMDDVLDAGVLARQLERDDRVTVVSSSDPDERARCLAAFDRLLAEPGWPSVDRLRWALALLCRGAGVDVAGDAIAAIAQLAGSTNSA